MSVLNIFHTSHERLFIFFYDRRGSRNFWWRKNRTDDMDEEKIGRGLGAAVGPQRGPGAEPLVGVKGAKPPIKVTLFSRVIQ
jgi:hypothetical protein